MRSFAREGATFGSVISPNIGEHSITVPIHKALAKGTLNDILSEVSLWNNISKADLIERLRRA